MPSELTVNPMYTSLKRLLMSGCPKRRLLFVVVLIVAATALAFGPWIYAQGSSFWVQAMTALLKLSTRLIAQGLVVVAIVMSGLMFAFAESEFKRTIAGILFRVAMAVGAAVGTLIFIAPYLFL